MRTLSPVSEPALRLARGFLVPLLPFFIAKSPLGRAETLTQAGLRGKMASFLKAREHFVELIRFFVVHVVDGGCGSPVW
jgi:hypothetical protein